MKLTIWFDGYSVSVPICDLSPKALDAVSCIRLSYDLPFMEDDIGHFYSTVRDHYFKPASIEDIIKEEDFQL